MIPLFRKFRQNLLENNKMGNYVKYALGEIVLVVIGILIALQINNWQKEVQNKSKEQYFYAGLQSDLAQQIGNLNDRIRSEAKSIDIANGLLTDFKVNDSFYQSDSLFYKINYLLGAPSAVNFKTTFNELNTTGQMELISDREIRNQVIEFYQYSDYISQIIESNLSNVFQRNLHPVLLNSTLFDVGSLFREDFIQDDFQLSQLPYSDRIKNVAEEQLAKNELALVNTLNLRLGIAILHKQRYMSVKEQAEKLYKRLEPK